MALKTSSRAKSKSISKPSLRARDVPPSTARTTWPMTSSKPASSATISSACHNRARLMRPSKRKRYQVQSMRGAPGGRVARMLVAIDVAWVRTGANPSTPRSRREGPGTAHEKIRDTLRLGARSDGSDGGGARRIWPEPIGPIGPYHEKQLDDD